ncbi:MAG: cupin domain-containing protein [Gemmatimonadota bacterium]
MSETTFYRWDDVERERVTDQIDRKLITGATMMLAQVFIRRGAIVPKHQHHNEQLTYILSGALHFRIGADGADEVTVRAGEVLHIPSNVWHEAEALEDTLDVDIFSPPREDWLNHTDTYFQR